jgi:hypothetical protein
MAIEQPNTSSADVAATDVSISAPGSDEPKSEASESPSWWQRITRRPSYRGGSSRSEGGDQEGESGPSDKVALTQEELDRRIQAETDRREAKRAAEAKARERRELRDKDPWAYAEQEREAEVVQQTTQEVEQFFVGVGSQHDRVTIDPLWDKLPDSEKQRILGLDGAGRGLTGRKLVVDEALKALEKHYRAEGAREAEAKLRRNPAFRKQVLAEGRGSAVEPDLLPAVGASAADHTMSALLRKHYDLG